MAVINNASVYDYYLNTYAGDSAPNRPNRFDSHKKSELRDVYGRILKANRESPLYKLKVDPESMTRFAIDLKENARHMQNVVSALSTEGDDIESIFYKKVAVSSNPDAVGVEYVGDKDSTENPTFDLGVKRLATPQVNTGNFLPATGHDFEEGTYSFDLDIGGKSFEFQYNVMYGDNNYDVQQRISRLINSSNLALSSRVLLNNDNRTSALQIVSKHTGLAEDEEFLFRITSGSNWKEMNILGINEVTEPAQSSIFTLNDAEHSSLANTFTINKAFEVSIHGTTPDGEPAHIGFKANTEAIADSVEELVTSFNGFVAVGQKYQNDNGHNQLLNELHGLARSFGDELSQVGIGLMGDGSMFLDREVIADAVTSEDAKKAFGILNKFKDALEREAQKTSVNPMNYVDKVTVEYKHPTKTFTAPYATSIYSGLLVNQAL
ncbi:MAG: flagellar capping protein [Lachnospiraceae bacterium]|nr:flagellar capping protein [Lachnospiraceae bacterium]